ncbi:MAG: family 43 glycosylhydrolase, partial [Microbacteriaceae bacterium]
MTPFRNPVLPGFHPDPSVCRVGETFYLVNSSFEYFPGLPIYRSHDLVFWQSAGAVLAGRGQIDLSDAEDSGGLYAPTIRYHDGTFFVVCTIMGKGAARGSFLVTAPHIDGPWSRPRFVEDARGNDPSLFFHDGRVWWIGCRLVEPGAYRGQTEIWLREFDLAAGRLVGAEHILCNGGMRGAVWAEGPHLYARDGWIYLVTAEGGTGRDHSVMVARSRSVTGPYQGNPRNPSFTHRHLSAQHPVQCVGHAELIEDAYGDWWALVLGTRPDRGNTLLGRETFLTPVDWEDGWPVFNPGVGRLSEVVTLAAAVSAATAESAGSAGSGLTGTEWMSLRGPADFTEATPRGLRLHARRLSLAGVSAGTPAFLGRRLQHHRWTASTTLLIEGGDSPIIAGLAVRQSGAFQVRAELNQRDGRWFARGVSRAADVETVTGGAAISGESSGSSSGS